MRRYAKIRLLSVIFTVLLLSGWASEGVGKTPVEASVNNRYKLRTTGSTTDQDLEDIFSLSVGGANDAISLRAQGGVIFDLDGSDGGSTYTNVYNSFSSAAVGRLYSAYLDVKKVGLVHQFRLGRQQTHDFESFYFDGLSIESVPLYGVTLSAFGGSPVHQFESQLGSDPGDWLLGTALQWNPISRISIRFDYAHIKDEASGFRTTLGDQEDDILGASLWLDLHKYFDVFSRLTAFSDQVRDVEINSTFKLPQKNLSVRLSAYRLLQGYDIRVLEEDIYSVAGTYARYSEFSLSATKGFAKYFWVDGGFSLRMLDDTQKVSPFNHGFERFYLSLSTIDLGLKGLSLSTTGDYYKGEDSNFKNDNFGASFSVAQKLLDDRLTVKGGTAHYLYRYNVLAGNESYDVQTYFAGIEGKVRKRVKLKAGYEFEDNSLNGFHSLTTGLTWNFY